MRSNLQITALQTFLSDFQIVSPSNEETIDVFQNTNQQEVIRFPSFPTFPPDDYILLEALGKGGNGIVRKAFHKRGNRLVALKKIPKNLQGNSNATRIRIETEIIQKLIKHKTPYFLEYYGIYQDNTDIYIEMQPALLTLGELIETGRSFSHKEILFILSKITDSMLFLQTEGIANRDIKPSNILLIPDPTDPHQYDFKLYDFGIGYLYSHNEPNKKIHKNTLLGYTPEFTAPELGRILGFYDQNTEFYDPYVSDIYSLGLTGLKMMGGGFRELHEKNVNEFIEDNGDLGEVLACMLVPEINRRIKLRELKEMIDKIIRMKNILPPKIEKSIIWKTLEKRCYKQKGGDYRLVVLEFLENMRIYFEIGKFTEFERYLELALFELIKTDSLIKFSQEEVNILKNCGDYYRRIGEFKKSEKVYKKAIAQVKILLWGQNDGSYSELAGKLGELYLSYNKFDEAEKYLIEAYSVNLGSFGNSHLFTLNSMRRLGELYLKKGDFGKSFEFLNPGLQTLSSMLYSEEKPSNSEILQGLISLLDFDEIGLLRILLLLEQNQGNFVLASLEALAQREGNLTPEEELYRKVYRSKLQAWKKVHRVINRDLALMMGVHGRLNMALGDFKKAQKLFVRALKILIGEYGECNWEAAKLYRDLSNLHEKWDDFKKAEVFGLRALEIRKRIASESLENFESLRDMERIYEKMGDGSKRENMRKRIEKCEEEIKKYLQGGL